MHRFLVVSFLLLQSTSLNVVHAYSVVAPTDYTALTGPIRVRYSIPRNVTSPSGYLELVALSNNTVIQDVDIQGYEGELTLSCGLVDQAGNYVFRLRIAKNGQLLTSSQVMRVTWPAVSIKIPRTHVTLTIPLKMEITVEGHVCASHWKSSKYMLELHYMGANRTTCGNKEELVFDHEIKLLKSDKMTFDCSFVDRAGLYRVLLKSNHVNAPTIARSEILLATWSAAYRLDVVQQSVYPCSRTVAVSFEQPSCARRNDKIRLFKHMPQAASTAAAKNMVYISEQHVKHFFPHKTVEFSCDLFHESIPAYCFKYISVASSGCVHVQRTVCVPTQAGGAAVIDGGWSEWSQYSGCSATRPCTRGTQVRTRTCTNPKPQLGGDFCKGKATQHRECAAKCSGTTTDPAWGVFTPDPSCQCAGCIMSDPAGQLATNLRCSGSTVWTIVAEKGKAISLSFKVFTLVDRNRETWVKVRDGDSQMSRLLLHRFGGALPHKVTSKGHVMLVEFMAPYDRRQGYQHNTEGFVAIYSTHAANKTLTENNAGISGESIWESTVTIVGITLCGLIVLASIAFICRNRHMAAVKRQKKTTHRQGLLNGELVATPSHSNSTESPARPPLKYHEARIPESPSKNDRIASISQQQPREYILARTLPIDHRSNRYSHPLQSPIREVQVDASKCSSRSSLPCSPSHSACSSLPSPYQSSAHEYLHDPDSFRVTDQPHRCRHHKQHRRQQHRAAYTAGGIPPQHDVIAEDSRHVEMRQDYRPQDVMVNRHAQHPPKVAQVHAQRAELTRSNNAGYNGSNAGSNNESAITNGYPENGKGGQSTLQHRTYDSLPSTTCIQPQAVAAVRNANPSSHKQQPLENRPLRPASGMSPEQAPLAAFEDLTPTAAAPPAGPMTQSPRHHAHAVTEHNPMESYNTYEYLHTPSDTSAALDSSVDIPNRRPPCEGRDGTLTRAAKTVTSPDKPSVKPLPLRYSTRPDGQSPENKVPQEEQQQTQHPSPQEGEHDLSPILQKSQLFTEAGSHQTTPSNDGFEYDDYVGEALPGSYFNMDRHAYTLTWSNKQPWQPGSPQKKSSSQKAPAESTA